VHVGAPPSEVAEPVDGIVEMIGAGLYSRLRYDDAPVTHGAILALLKQTDGQDTVPLLFSPTELTGAAEALGENLKVASFEVTPIGDAVPQSPAARSLMPHEQFEPPFRPENDPNATDGLAGGMLSAPEIAAHEWVDCPSCGTTHHPSANFCHICGADMTERLRSCQRRSRHQTIRRHPRYPLIRDVAPDRGPAVRTPHTEPGRIGVAYAARTMSKYRRTSAPVPRGRPF
jgi:hypothetical protein